MILSHSLISWVLFLWVKKIKKNWETQRYNDFHFSIIFQKIFELFLSFLFKAQASQAEQSRARQAISQPQPVRHLASQAFSQPASQSVSQTTSQSWSQPDRTRQTFFFGWPGVKKFKKLENWRKMFMIPSCSLVFL